MQDSGDDRDEAKKSGQYLRLGLASLTSIFFLAVVAIALAYIGGIMSGRASASRQFSPALTGSAQVGGNGAAQSREEPVQQRITVTDRILTAEELEFARALRKEGNSPLEKIAPKPAEEKSAEKPAQASQAGTEAQPEARPEASQNVQPQEVDDSQIADYLFQLGAFRDEKTVDELREKLEGHGLRTSMQRDGKLLLVFVRLRGTEKRAQEIIQLAADLGLGKPLLRQKKAVSQ